MMLTKGPREASRAAATLDPVKKEPESFIITYKTCRTLVYFCITVDSDDHETVTPLATPRRLTSFFPRKLLWVARAATAAKQASLSGATHAHKKQKLLSCSLLFLVKMALEQVRDEIERVQAEISAVETRLEVPLEPDEEAACPRELVLVQSAGASSTSINIWLLPGTGRQALQLLISTGCGTDDHAHCKMPAIRWPLPDVQQQEPSSLGHLRYWQAQQARSVTVPGRMLALCK